MVESKFIKRGDLKTYSMFYYYHAWVWSVFRTHYTHWHFTLLQLWPPYRPLLCTAQQLPVPLLCHTPATCENEQAATITGSDEKVHQACSLSVGCVERHYSYQGLLGGNDALLKRRWNLNVYLKYIQKEVTVSLSCAGFYNSPFSISHVRKMFLLLVTAQRTIFMYYSITSMQINHRNVYT